MRVPVPRCQRRRAASSVCRDIPFSGPCVSPARTALPALSHVHTLHGQSGRPSASPLQSRSCTRMRIARHATRTVQSARGWVGVREHTARPRSTLEKHTLQTHRTRHTQALAQRSADLCNTVHGSTAVLRSQPSPARRSSSRRQRPKARRLWRLRDAVSLERGAARVCLRPPARHAARCRTPLRRVYAPQHTHTPRHTLSAATPRPELPAAVAGRLLSSTSPSSSSVAIDAHEDACKTEVAVTAITIDSF
jgi:hypothetical protein